MVFDTADRSINSRAAGDPGQPAPRSRDFARASGRLAKTDAIDASVIAHFGEALKPPLRPLRDRASRELSALVARRQQLIGMLTAEKKPIGFQPIAQR